MRLSSENRTTIKEIFKKYFENDKLYLFGSRTDDKKKGGDIDLLILSDKKYNFSQISDFNTDLILSIGDRRFDILNFTYDSDSPFLKLIMMDSIEL